MEKQDVLLSEFKLRNLTFRNRIFSSSHAPSYVVNAQPRDRYRLYHEEKAKGGIALTMIGGSTNVSPDSPSVFGQINGGEDAVIPWYQKLTSGVKKHGAAIMCQITHMGRRTVWDVDHWLPVIGPSGTRERAHRAFPKKMEAHDISRVVDDYAAAAKRCELGGFDGIEVLTHAHLLGQFMSPHINKRDDDYGGTLHNRLRLTFQVLDAIRSSVDRDFIIGVRMTGDEELATGLCERECIEIAKELEASGDVDFLNIIGGAPYDDLGLAGWVRPMGLPAAPHVELAGRIKKAVTIPVMHAGGISDLATARYAISEGLLDMVGMTRSHMADPYLVSKLAAKQEESIRPCVGMGYCVDRTNQGKDSLCGHNPTTGREEMFSHIIPKAKLLKKVVIVGGGCAGLEAARISSARGHSVTLLEATNRLGGQLNLACRGDTRRQLQAFTDWLVTTVERSGVDVRLNTYADVSDILTLHPDTVIIATGGWQRELEAEGAELATPSFDVLSGQATLSGNVLLWDETGTHGGAVAADVLANSASELTYSTPDRAPLIELGLTTYSVALRDLYQKGVKFYPNIELVTLRKDRDKILVVARNTLTKALEQWEFDSVVVETGVEPADDIYHQLSPLSRNLGEVTYAELVKGNLSLPERNKNGSFDLFRIGDAVSSRNIHAATFDALRHCYTL